MIFIEQRSVKKFQKTAEFCQISKLSISRLTLSYTTLSPQKENSAKNLKERVVF